MPMLIPQTPTAFPQLDAASGAGSAGGRKTGPLDVEPLTEQLGFFKRLGRLDQAQRIAGRDAQSIGAE